MSFIPHLHFNGQCAAAMTFYAAAFGGTDLQMMRYADAPEGSGEKTPASERIIHAQFTLGDGTLMASDFPEGIGEPQKAVSVMHSVAGVEAAAALCETLFAGGGDWVMPFGPTFFAPGFGVLRDRFGTHWMTTALQA